MNRGGGKAAILAKKRREDLLAKKGAELNEAKWAQMRAQMKAFQAHLEAFAHAHKDSIQNDPAFRAQFHKMCATIGVDPLTSRKGIWSELLGVGDYYYELAVRAIEVCVATRGINGGFLALDELVRALRKKRTAYVENVSKDDVERAVSKLDVLGGGYKVVSTGKGKIVKSVPLELSLDHTKVLEHCGTKGYTSVSELRSATGWSQKRITTAVDFLINKEIAWVDKQSKETTYWILGLLSGSTSQS